jgi:hypothetical protein
MQCGETVTDNCGQTDTCTSSLCTGTEVCDMSYSPPKCDCSDDANCTTVPYLVCDFTTVSCVSCVPPGDHVAYGGASCADCCSGRCTGGGGAKVCGCGSDVDCTEPTEPFCDTTTDACVSCVPSGNDVGSLSACKSECCAGSCSGGSTCK